MVAEEKRTLEISARVRDFASSTLRRIGRAGTTLAKTLTAPFAATFRAVTNLRGAMVALLGVFALTRIKAFIDTLREGLDELAKTSVALGVTAESFQAMRFAANQAGVQFEQLRVGLTQFERNIENARRGARNQVEALAKLGISVQSLRGDQLDLVEVLGTVGDGLQGIQSQSARAAVLLDLFGESGLRLAPLLNQGSAGIKALADQAERLGIIFSREELRQVEAFNDAVDRLSSTVRAFFQRIVVEIAPTIRAVVDEITERLGGAQDVARRVAMGIVNAAETMAVAFVRLSDAVSRSAGFISNTLTGLGGAAQIAAASFKTLFGEDLTEAQRELARGTAQILVATRALFQEEEARGAALEAQVEQIRAFFRAIREGQEASAAEQKPLLPELSGPEADERLSKLKELRDTIADLVNLRDRGENVTGQLVAARGELASMSGIFEGIKQGALAGADAIHNLSLVAFQAGRSFTNTFQASLEGAFTDIITGAKNARDAFKDFAQQVLRSIAQIVAKIASAAIVRSFFGAFFPGSFETGGIQRGQLEAISEFARGGVLKDRRFQDGGIARSPTLALFGEGRNAEAFVPLPDNRTIPVTLSGGADRSPTILQFFIEAMDGQSVRRVLIEQSSTIKQIYSNGIETQPGQRHIVQRVTQ